MAEPISTLSATPGPQTLPSLPIHHQTAQSSRKRRRSSKYPDTNTPDPKVSKAALSPEYTAKILTGAAAVAEEQRASSELDNIEARRTSPNPARQVLGNLLGTQGGMSSEQDAPSQEASLSKPLAEGKPSGKLSATAGQDSIAVASHTDGAISAKSWNATSLGSNDDAPTATITANGVSVASPGRIDDTVGEDDDGRSRRDVRLMENDAGSAEPEEGRSNKAFTYPGPMLSAQGHRTSSLPQSGYGDRRESTRSPSTKRHKCPYCSTDFTRHHNLKSHLLTHSHEKPYSCDTCEARFRRLHDLKRHTKLHTGERPHVCPKCDRSFARGDALARHTKGQGGCAGRRSSVGSFGGEERHEGSMRAGDGDSMPGIMYTAEASHEPEHMDEDTEGTGGRSLPSIRKHDAPPEEHHTHPEQSSLYQSRQPSTYPPVATRQPGGGLYPPPLASPRGSSGTATSQSSISQLPHPPVSNAATGFQASGPNVFAQGGMTESPKPLSPGAMNSHQLGQPDSGVHRNRSPSLTQQLQQHNYSRRLTGNNTSPPISLPPPHAGGSHLNTPQLPSLPGLNPPERGFTLQGQVQGIGPSPLHSSASNALPGAHHGPSSPSYPPGNTSSANNSLSSHSTGHHSSFDRHPNPYNQPNDQLMSYIRNLEAKLENLQNEVTSLRSQVTGGSQQHR